MKFDIEKHVLDHHCEVFNHPITKLMPVKHFNTSCHTAYFIAAGYGIKEKIDDVMLKIANNILTKQYKFVEKNGIYLNRFGEHLQKYRTRNISFENLFCAYHNEHFDRTKDVNTHFHFLITKDDRTGKGYTYLKQALEHEATQFGIKFNFQEKKQLSGLSKYELKSLKNLSWNLQESNQTALQKLLSDKKKMEKYLDLFVMHYRESENISFFFKVILMIHEKLNQFNIDLKYLNHNLKENIFLLLTDECMDLITSLQNFEDVTLDLSKEFDRQVLQYAHGFDSMVMDFISDKFDIFKIKKSQITLSDDGMHDDEQDDVVEGNFFRQFVIKDIRNAVAYAKNENEVKTLLIQSGEYNKITTKTRKKSDGKREKIGFEVVTSKKSKLFLPWSELGLSYPRLQKVFKHNVKKAKEKKTIKSDLSSYKKRKLTKKDKKFKKFVFKMQSLLQFIPVENTLNKVDCIDLNLRGHYEVSRSDLYDITTYKNEKSMFVSYSDNITLKKSPINMSLVINDMLDIAEKKGWNIRTIHIKGQKELTRKTKELIDSRIHKKDNTQKLQLKM